MIVAGGENLGAFVGRKGRNLVQPIAESIEDNALSYLVGTLNFPVMIGQRNGGPMKLDIGYVDGPGFGAFCGGDGDVDVIGIYQGSVAVLQKHVDQIVDEALKDDTLSCDLSFLHRNDIRRDIVIMSLVYLARHEFAHVYNGHTLFAGSCKPRRLINEDGHLPYTVLKTLEMDADCMANQGALEAALRPKVKIIPGELSRWALPRQTHFGSLMHALSAAIFAIQICHLIEGDLAISERPNYPTSLCRAQMMLTQSVGILTLRTPIPEKTWIDAIWDATVAVR